MNRDPRVDAYIASRQPFARPILTHVREVVHQAAPDIEEAIKWSHVAFTRRGKLFLGMAAFKEHAALNFWHGALATGGTGVEDEAMGSFGRLTSPADLPDDAELAGMIKKAVALVDAGVKPPHMANRKPRPELPVPQGLTDALDKNPKAAGVWASLAPSHRREYCEWIGEAKRPETAAKRVGEAVAWIAEGKKRNWKYENC
ncbi:MAG: YdeI/OmpD-associated family protein [Sphingomonadaceae bacterium]|nr:YdeI/OmpD-associated family protein [Sphingomonadaceae bacterium]